MNYETTRVVPRFPLPKEKMKFVFAEGEKVFAVRDISRRGLGISLLEFDESLYFPTDYRCQAELKIDEEPMLVHVRVKRVNAWSVGFEFEDLDPAQEERLKAFVDPLHIGATLKLVDPRGAPGAFGTGLSAWYHGDSATDLYIWNDTRGGLRRALFSSGERFWEWEEGSGIATGKVELLEGDRTILHKDATPEVRTRALVRKVLEHAEVLDYRLVSFLKEKT
ncbi:MAG: PilZ domain-containing protein [Proteobacteria bacterium]|nr:MAG: PilZ domain-containing protein [Pseudomonadota bacterium]